MHNAVTSKINRLTYALNAAVNMYILPIHEISTHHKMWYIFLALVDTPHMLGSRYYAVAWDNLCAVGQMIPTFSIRTSFPRCTASDKMCIAMLFLPLKYVYSTILPAL